jgi:glycosyltransferase involved in cell wall biosynthesis
VKVLHVISGLRQTAGGTVTALVGLARAQQRQGLDVTIASSFVHPEDAEVTQIRARGLKVETIGPCGRPRSWHPGMREWVGRLVAANDVVHVHALWEQIQHHACRAARHAGVPYVISPHGMLDPWSLAQGALKKKLYLALRMRRNLNGAAAIHYTTGVERDLAAPLQLRGPSIVEPIGLDMTEFDPPPPRGTFRARFPQLGERRFAIFLGRIHRKKGLDLLIPAFGHFKDRETMLVIAGPDDENYLERAKALVAEHELEDRVRFVGMLRGRERVEALVDAHLFVLPSYQENFGIAVIESLATGTPVVISDRVNICNEVREARVGGVVPTEVEPLAREIERWMSDEDVRKGASLRAIPFVRERYDWDQIAKRWVGHYETLSRRRVPL